MKIALLVSIIFPFVVGIAVASQKVVLTEECVLSFPAGTVFLADPRADDLPEGLAGVNYRSGEVSFYDLISQQLIVVGCDAEEEYRFGTQGSGPEDHQMRCDPILWRNTIPSVVDYSLPPKIINLTKDGRYNHSFDLETTNQVMRLVWVDDRALGFELTHKMDKQGNFVIGIFMVSFDEYGGLIKRMHLGDHPLNFGADDERRADQLEVFPRFAYRGGRIYIQKDVYKFALDCYSSDFEELWHFAEDIDLIPDPNPYVNVNMPGLVPPEYYHPIRSLWAQDDGELWVELETGNGVSGDKQFRVLTADGHSGDTVAVEGFPETPGSITFIGDHVIWGNINSDGMGKTRFIRVYGIE